MDAEKFTELIGKYEAGNCTEDERVLVEKWLKKRGTENMFSRITAEEQETIKGRTLQRLLAGIIHEKKGHHRVYLLPVMFRAAAVILIVIASIYLLWQFAFIGTHQMTTLQQTSAIGQIKKIMLADGSIVWLKNQSTLAYPKEFSTDSRHVILTGEALFEVTKDPEHPFIIECGDLTAEVLGTSFNIKASEGNIEVVVLTGKVSLSSTHDQQDIIVLPNEKAIYDGNGKNIAKVIAQEQETTKAIAGTTYDMHFADTQMVEVIRRIENKFDINVQVDDARLNSCIITVDFTDQSLQNTLDIVARVLAVTYEIEDKKITLKGSGCH